MGAGEDDEMAGRKQAWGEETLGAGSAGTGGRSGGAGAASKRRREEMKQQRLAKMGGVGWNLSTTDTDIPAYSAEGDKYCPWARTPKMRKRFEGSRKRERLEREAASEELANAVEAAKESRDAKLLEIGGGTLESHHKNMILPHDG